MVLTFPTAPSQRSGRFRLVSNASRFTSALTRVQQSVSRGGDFWAAQLDLPTMTMDTARPWAALIAQLAGGRNSVYVSPPSFRSFTAGSPLVNGVGLVGTNLPIDTATPNLALKAGDFLSYNTSTFRMLHMLVADTTLNGSGAGTLNILPAIRKSPPDNAPVNFVDPSCEMLLDGSDADVLALSNAWQFGVSLSLIEAVRA